jgi:hypothetical protein
VTDVGRALVVLGIVLVVLGVLIVVAGRVPWIGRLPGDIHVRRDGWSFYFPLTTSILVSLLISIVLYLVGRR